MFFFLTSILFLLMQTNQPTKLIFGFSEAASVKPWQIINDGVMGGLSRSSIEWGEGGTAIFSGEVSLENNGGFASVRTAPKDFGLENFSGIHLRIKGDGKSYKFRIRTNDNFDGVVYSIDFFAPANEWTETRLPFSEFRPTFRGRTLAGVPPLRPADIRQLGFLISEKQEGGFWLEVDWIGVF